jgi:hypothetical protein
MSTARGVVSLVIVPPAYHWLLEAAAVLAFCAAAVLLLWL